MPSAKSTNFLTNPREYAGFGGNQTKKNQPREVGFLTNGGCEGMCVQQRLVRGSHKTEHLLIPQTAEIFDPKLDKHGTHHLFMKILDNYAHLSQIINLFYQCSGNFLQSFIFATFDASEPRIYSRWRRQ